MKIKKYASGGVYTPFNPPIQTNTASKTKNSGSSGSSKLPELPFKEQLIELISAKGLPSDATVFSQELAEVLHRVQHSPTDVPAYMAVAFANKANTMDQIKGQFDAAYEQVITRETSQDIATHGQFMYVEDLSKSEDEREITLITPTQYLENPKQWKVLTNQDILHARKYDTNLAFNVSTIIADAADSTNMKRLREMWRTETKALATQSNSGQLSQSVQMQDYVTGARLLQQNGGELDSSTTLRNEHVQSYLSFLYSSMSEKEKGYLQNYMAVKGIVPESKNILEFMFNNIVDYVATSSTYSPESKGSKSGNGDDGDLTGSVQDNQALRIQQFEGQQERIILKCKPGSPNEDMGAFETIAIKQGKFITNDGNPIVGPITLSELMGKAIAFAAADTRHVYIGNKQLGEGARTKTCWSGSEIEEVLLPWMRQEDGSIRPWFELMVHVGNLNAKNKSLMESHDYLKKHGLEQYAKYNSVTKKWELTVESIPFLVFKAYVGEEYISLTDEDKKFFETVPKEDGEYLANIMNSWKDWGWLESDNESDNIYAGNIYIPITTGWATFNSTANQYYDKNVFTDVSRKQTASQILNEAKTDPSAKKINSNFTK